jgi:hypothetical protein
MKEGAIEALVKCLARITENVHTIEEYFDTVYPITVSLESLHTTRNFLFLFLILYIYITLFHLNNLHTIHYFI